MLATAASGCALGIGAATSADPRVHGLGVGVSAGTSLAYTRVAPEATAAAPKYGANFRGGVLAMTKGLGGALEYESRYEEGTYAGDYGTMLRSRAVMGYAAYSPRPGLGLDLGAGYIHKGTFGYGGRGNVLNDNAASLSSGSASGVRVGLRLNWELFAAGPGGAHRSGTVMVHSDRRVVWETFSVPLSTTLQLECAYAWVDVGSGRGLPGGAQTMSLSAALVFALF
jgi:hypothetical protein